MAKRRISIRERRKAMKHADGTKVKPQEIADFVGVNLKTIYRWEWADCIPKSRDRKLFDQFEQEHDLRMRKIEK